MKTVNAIIKFPPIGQPDVANLENTQLAFVNAKRDSLPDLNQLALKLGDDTVYFSSDANNGETFATKTALKEQYDLLTAEIQDLMSKGATFKQSAEAAIGTLNAQTTNLSAGLISMAGVANAAEAKADDAYSVATNAIAAINDANAQIKDIGNSLATISAGVASNATAISAASARMDGLDSALATITGNVANNTANISYNKASIDELDNALITVTASVTNNTAKINDALSRISDLKQNVAEYISQTNMRFIDLNTSLATIAYSVSVNATDIAGIKTSVSSIGTRMDGFDGSLATISANVAGNTSDIADIKASISDIESGADDIGARMDGFDKSLSTISASVSTASGDIADLKFTTTELNQSVTAQFAQLATITATLSGIANNVAANATAIDAVKQDLYGDGTGATIGAYLSGNLIGSSTIDIAQQTNPGRLSFSVSSLPSSLVTYANAGLPGVANAQQAIDALLGKIADLETRIAALESA